MTEVEFINSEIAVWGEDYIFDLIEHGYTPIQLDNGKWSWLYSANAVVTLDAG